MGWQIWYVDTNVCLMETLHHIIKSGGILEGLSYGLFRELDQLWDTANKQRYLTVESGPVEHAETKILFYETPVLRLSVLDRSRLDCQIPAIKKLSANRVGQALRVGYRYLGKALARQHSIPDPDLLYFLTHYEIKEFVSHGDHRPRLIARAERRRRVRSMQVHIELPEIARGYPVPITKKDQAPLKSSKSFRGTPVSSGYVTAPVRVCKTVEEAINIKKGEILVAHCTDIAWSVYFPLLGGVVTELGGLLSHGAVVAREYGLPCVVSAKGATEFCCTGDICTLDANRGLISMHET